MQSMHNQPHDLLHKGLKMDSYVFFIVLFAAFTHALWHFATKKVSGNFTIFWYGLYFVSILQLGYTFYLLASAGFNRDGLVFLFVTSAAHFFYFVTFLYTYSKSEISSVYPISRGTGVAGTSIFSYFFFHEIITPVAAMGIASVFLGIMFIGFSSLRNQKMDKKTFLVAFLTGITIIIYSLTDKQGVAFNNPVMYLNFANLIALTPMVFFANRGGFKKSFSVFRANFKYAMIIGFGSIGTYLIILYAMTLERASYIVSMREFSVVIASFLGFIFLKEKPTVLKIIGILCVATGLILIKAG